MTHDDRLRLIHRSFVITYFPTSYPWGGNHTGNHWQAMIDKVTSDNYTLVRGKRIRLDMATQADDIVRQVRKELQHLTGTETAEFDDA